MFFGKSASDRRTFALGAAVATVTLMSAMLGGWSLLTMETTAVGSDADRKPLATSHFSASLLSEALAAEGIVEPARHALYAGLVEQYVAVFLAESPTTDPAARAAELRLFLHANVLRGKYQPTADSVAHALAGGDYNCLSATLIFNVLAQRVGLPVQAVETTAHVQSVLLLPGREQWLETTRPTGNVTPPVDVFRRLDDRQLVALIHYNQGVDALAAGRFDLAVVANRRALAHDSDHQPSQANLAAALNNWAVACWRAGDRQQAAVLLSQGLRIAPHDAQLRHNRTLCGP